MTIPILNENLITICEKYGYNIPKANEQVLNRYIKDILKDLSEQLPSLKEKVPTKLTMKQKEALRKEKKEPETDLNGNVIVPRYECVTSHTARRTEHHQHVPQPQVHHPPDDARQRPQDAKRPSWITLSYPPRR